MSPPGEAYGEIWGEDWWKESSKAPEPGKLPKHDWLSPAETPCKRWPERCGPRQATHVVFDADGVIWHLSSGIASSVCGPYKLIDPDTVEAHTGSCWREKGEEEKPLKEEKKPEGKKPYPWWKEEKSKPYKYRGWGIRHEGKEPPAKGGESLPPKVEWEGSKVTVRLLPGFRDTLGKLKDRGITVSVSSLNTEGSVKGLLRAFGLLDSFVEVRDNWDQKKKSVEAIAEKHKVAPCQMLFIDDTMHNVEGVSELGVLGLMMGRDIKTISELLDYVK